MGTDTRSMNDKGLVFSGGLIIWIERGMLDAPARTKAIAGYVPGGIRLPKSPGGTMVVPLTSNQAASACLHRLCFACNVIEG